MDDLRVYKRILRKMGYLADQQGIIDRYLRERGGWDSHLFKCREYILKKVKSQAVSDITVLGSGWLLDVPLEELSELCNNIYLVDIHHPRQVRRRAEKLVNVNLITSDITAGLINSVWKNSKRDIISLDEIEVPLFTFDFDPGLIVSLNLLTQTDSVMNEFLVNSTSLSNEDYRRFRSRIQNAHLEFLKAYPHLIITDYEEEILDIDKDVIIKTNSLLFTDLPDSGNKEEWLWIFDSSGEYYGRKRVTFKVMAIDNSKR